jgi:hypothetical protein
MDETKANTITVNEVEYTEDQLSNEEKILVSHAADLDRQISAARFHLDQLQVGKDAFVNMLATSLEAPTQEAPIQDAEVSN